MESSIVYWLPTVIASSAMAYIWFDIRSFKKDMQDKKKRLDDEFITKDRHTLVCENQGLKVENRINALEVKIDSGFQSIEKLIKRAT